MPNLEANLLILDGGTPNQPITLQNNGGLNLEIGTTSGPFIDVTMRPNTRTAIDLLKSSTDSLASIAEYTLRGSVDDSIGMSWTWNGYINGFNLYEEASNNAPTHSITIGLADHNNLGNAYNGGVDRASIKIIGSLELNQGPYGSVNIGSYAQKNNESQVDNAPISALIIRPPDWSTSTPGYGDSHTLVLGGISYNAGNPKRIIWGQKVNLLANDGTSQFVISSSNYNVSGGQDTFTPTTQQFSISDIGEAKANIFTSNSINLKSISGEWNLYISDDGTTRQLNIKGPNGTVNTIWNLIP